MPIWKIHNGLQIDIFVWKHCLVSAKINYIFLMPSVNIILATGNDTVGVAQLSLNSSAGQTDVTVFVINCAPLT